MTTIEELMAKGIDDIKAEIVKAEEDTKKALDVVERSKVLQQLLDTQKARDEAMAAANAAVEAVKAKIPA